MNYIGNVVMILLVISVPVCLVTWVWTGDHRWFATGLLIVAFLVTAGWVSRDKP